MIDWSKLTEEDGILINKIVMRAGEEFADIDRVGLNMDISAIHISGMPLDLEKLLAFEPFDFAHDIFGIREHLDRNTGELRDCFLPRCVAE